WPIIVPLGFTPPAMLRSARLLTLKTVGVTRSSRHSTAGRRAGRATRVVDVLRMNDFGANMEHLLTMNGPSGTRPATGYVHDRRSLRTARRWVVGVWLGIWSSLISPTAQARKICANTPKLT